MGETFWLSTFMLHSKFDSKKSRQKTITSFVFNKFAIKNKRELIMEFKITNSLIHQSGEGEIELKSYEQVFSEVSFMGMLIDATRYNKSGDVIPKFREGEVVFTHLLHDDGKLMEETNIVENVRAGIGLANRYEEYLDRGEFEVASDFNTKNKGNPRKIYDVLSQSPVDKIAVENGKTKLLIDKKKKRIPIERNIKGLRLTDAIITALSFASGLSITIQGYAGRSGKKVKLECSDEYAEIFFKYARNRVKLDVTYNIIYSKRNPKEGELITIQECSAKAEQQNIFNLDEE
jgi:hypothetical protein